MNKTVSGHWDDNGKECNRKEIQLGVIDAGLVDETNAATIATAGGCRKTQMIGGVYRFRNNESLIQFNSTQLNSSFEPHLTLIDLILPFTKKRAYITTFT